MFYTSCPRKQEPQDHWGVGEMLFRDGSGISRTYAIPITGKSAVATQQFVARPKPLSPSQIITTPGAKLTKTVKTVLSKSVVCPLSHNNWIDQRRTDFTNFITVDGKKNANHAIFANFSRGIATGRDAWSYNSNKPTLENNFNNCIAVFNGQIDARKRDPEGFERENDPSKIKWTRGLRYVSRILKTFLGTAKRVQSLRTQLS